MIALKICFWTAQGLIHADAEVRKRCLEKLEFLYTCFQEAVDSQHSYLIQKCERSMFNVKVVEWIMTRLAAKKFASIPEEVSERCKFIFGGFGGTVIIENANKVNRMEEKLTLNRQVRRTRRFSALIKSDLAKEFDRKDPVKEVLTGTGQTHTPNKAIFNPGMADLKDDFKDITDRKNWSSFTAQSVLSLAADNALFQVRKALQNSQLCGKSWKSAFLAVGHFFQPVTPQAWKCVVPGLDQNPNLFFWVVGHLDGAAIGWPFVQTEPEGLLLLDKTCRSPDPKIYISWGLQVFNVMMCVDYQCLDMNDSWTEVCKATSVGGPRFQRF